MEMTLGEIAKEIGAELHGDAGRMIRGLCDWKWVSEGGEDLLAFQVRSPTDRDYLASPVQAMIVPALPEPEFCLNKHYLVVQDPRYAFALIAGRFDPLPRATETRIHETAVIHETATLEEPVEIGPWCVIGARARIAKGCVLQAQVYVEADCRIGEDSVLEPFVALLRGTQIGKRNHLGTGAKLGVSGFGNVQKGGRFLRTPQLGVVVTEDDVHVGANACVDRATLGETRLEEGVRLDNMVHVGHNCRVGAHSGVAAQVGMAGSTEVGKNCLIGGQAAFSGHLRIADYSVILGQSGVIQDIPKAGVFFGTPARPARLTHRIHIASEKLPDLMRRVRALEARLAQQDS